MSTSYEIGEPDVFTAGTVGEPGQRVFYIQVRQEDLVLSLRCEKQQVAALAEYLQGLLEDLEPAPLGPPAPEADLTEPVQDLWTVGAIGVAYDEPHDRIVVVLEELVITDEEEDEILDEILDELTTNASVRVELTRAQAVAFVSRGRSLVEAGRPACRFCGLPIDPEGHPCPRMN